MYFHQNNDMIIKYGSHKGLFTWWIFQILNCNVCIYITANIYFLTYSRKCTMYLYITSLTNNAIYATSLETTVTLILPSTSKL